jgi:hypothetical protein
MPTPTETWAGAVEALNTTLNIATARAEKLNHFNRDIGILLCYT